MTTIAEILFGSRLYGTATEKSDYDYKTVFVPPAREIVLQRVTNHRSNRHEKIDPSAKTEAGATEWEAFSLCRYLKHLAEGQTLALDMLFAPTECMLTPPAPVWQEIVNNRSRLLTRKTAQYLSYCQTQAKKYGIKGSRIHAVRHVLQWFDSAIAQHGPRTRLAEVADGLVEMVNREALEHCAFLVMPQIGGQSIVHFECCDLKASYRARLIDARAIYQRTMDRYGQRALMAESNQNVDWKALSHAVRVGEEAIELLSTGWVTFPRPERAHLLDIKLGKLPYQPVADEIEALFEKVQAAESTSSLLDEPDHGFIDDLVADVYGTAVVACFA